ncbi:hypothetical protein CANCADRAFT_917 [Tortispora caseinolytica NRRL Y-17796]|uniref:Ribosome maturation protein SDO1 n=1 Tax=Tortispora caseinolytica NRRL Y-17796 TaxID=767744 RepID=A0A1E4TKP6_9ASCO|nr:hypothetical protein CANCADRAFT_917 [Tortispora caseinolytica NRRL Y-17796]
MPIQQPNTQIKLTNVSIVRMKKGKKRFEVACYQNKVQDWRKGIETDIDEVVQISTVFYNVSKGQVAQTEDLKKAFSTTDTDKIIREILMKGELQVGGKERQQQLSQVHAEIVQIIASRCVNPTNLRPYPVSIIEKTLSEIGFNTSPNKAAKAQALDAIKTLVESQIIPISRARMRVRISISPSKEAKKHKEKIVQLLESIESEDWDAEWECIAFIEPGKYRVLETLVGDLTNGQGAVSLLDTAVVKEGDSYL